MKKYRILLLLLVISLSASAQKYRTAAGARFGKNDFGITIQQKVMERSTLEGIAAFGGEEASGTLLLEKHFPILGKSFNWYVGGGAHYGQVKDADNFYGATGILGAEMKVPLVPLVISADLKPAFNFSGETFGGMSGGFSVRYILVKEKKEKKGLFGIFDNDKNDKKKKSKKSDSDTRGKGIFGF